MIGDYEIHKIPLRRSMGHKVCLRCGAVFLSDMRGRAKWCFKCKPIVKKEYDRTYKKGNKKFDECCVSK